MWEQLLHRNAVVASIIEWFPTPSGKEGGLKLTWVSCRLAVNQPRAFPKGGDGRDLLGDINPTIRMEGVMQEGVIIHIHSQYHWVLKEHHSLK